MMKPIFLLCLVLLWPLSSAAEDVVVQAHGYGDTYEQAMESALGDAVRQVHGATVATQSAGPKATVTVKESGEGAITTGYSGSNTDSTLQRPDKGAVKSSSGAARVDASGSSKTTIEAGMGSATDISSQGKVKRYRVLRQECGDKRCEVELEVIIEKFDFKPPSAQISRDSIVVMTTGKLRASGNADQLRQAILDRLVKSGRFTILDRSHDAAISGELALLASDEASDEQRAKLGQMLGADYMLLVNLTQASQSTSLKEERIDMTGETNREISRSTRASVRYTLVESATRAVRWSDSAAFNSGGHKLGSALEGFLDKIVGDIAEIVSPPKVVSVQGARIIINRGRGLAATGQVYDIYAAGEALIDPDTGEELGMAEQKVAAIRITTVQPKLAYGTVIQGDPAGIERGAIARLKAAAPPQPRTKKAPRSGPAASPPSQGIEEGGGITLQ
jgi:curli biogenesis system outer membrane secretion channel CsgG